MCADTRNNLGSRGKELLQDHPGKNLLQRMYSEVPPPVCALGCRCKIVKGKKCPPGYPKLNLLPNSGKRKHTIFSMFHVYYISHRQELIYILADLLFISR